MTRSEHYCAGKGMGELCGDYDREHNPSTVHDLMAATATDARLVPSQRPYLLGFLRGYRQSVRTFERGRWGT